MTNDNQPMPEAELQDELDLKSIVEATFGPGAFDLIDGEDVGASAEAEATIPDLSSLAEAEREVVPAEAVTTAAQAYPTELSRKLVLFELSDQLFAIPVSNVAEIQREQPITRIPHVPDWVSGVTNLRGSITSVVDLRMRLGLPSPDGAVRRRMMVIRSPSNITTCLLVDRVLGIRVLSDDPTALLDADRLMESLERLQETGADFVSEWRGMDMQPVAVLDLEKAIDLNQPNQRI